MTDSPLHIDIKNGVGCLLLNRPQALNALNLEMITLLSSTLTDWAQNETVQCVLLQGQGDRAFCAGGDLRRVYEALRQKQNSDLNALFQQEYRLNAQCAAFPKPFISVMQGYTMGGGMGISMYGSHRLVTETSQLAMPETSIGYFPDVGASYFLNKCPGSLGLYLALTGCRVSASEALYLNLATHRLLQSDVPAFCKALLSQAPNTSQEVEKILGPFIQKKDSISSLQTLRSTIDRIFGASSLAEILSGLEREESEFAQDCLKTLSLKSPWSLQITFELMKRAQGLSLEQCLEMDYQLSQKFIHHPDFQEGIRAVIIDKDNQSHWRSNSLDLISQDIVEEWFNFKSQPSLFS